MCDVTGAPNLPPSLLPPVFLQRQGLCDWKASLTSPEDDDLLDVLEINVLAWAGNPSEREKPPGAIIEGEKRAGLIMKVKERVLFKWKYRLV